MGAVRVLLDHAAADVDAAEAVSGKTALHLAVERGLEVGRGAVMSDADNISAADDPSVSQSQRRPLLGPSPG